METKNKSENLFEQYLDLNGFSGKRFYEPQISGISERPDYLLDYNGQKCFFEVKELREKLNVPIDPYKSLRDEIDEARKKFKNKEFKKYSCSLVVFNIDDLQARLDPLKVLGAMLGNLGFVTNFNTVENIFRGGGKMGKERNTRISAVIVLKECFDDSKLLEEMKKQGKQLTRKKLQVEAVKAVMEKRYVKVPGVVVVENPHAKMPFPADLFNGSFDERYRWVKENGNFGRVFIGNKLRELEELESKFQKSSNG